MNNDDKLIGNIGAFIWRRLVNTAALIVALLMLISFGVQISWAAFWLILLAYVGVTAALPLIVGTPVVLVLALLAWGADKHNKAAV